VLPVQVLELVGGRRVRTSRRRRDRKLHVDRLDGPAVKRVAARRA
jgi:hypothetical protein